jgi:hypothetical protein
MVRRRAQRYQAATRGTSPERLPFLNERTSCQEQHVWADRSHVHEHEPQGCADFHGRMVILGKAAAEKVMLRGVKKVCAEWAMTCTTHDTGSGLARNRLCGRADLDIVTKVRIRLANLAGSLAGLRRAKSSETFHPRKGRLRRLPCNKCPAAMPIWTGS